jgi:CBS domain containing-hemolysin-like protein
MVPRRLASVDVSTPFQDILRLVATSPYSRLPVYRQSPDDIIGIIHTKDVVTGFINERAQTSLTSLLRPLARVHGTIPADHLLNYMRDKRIHQVLVVGDGGRIEGLITFEDVVAELIGGVSDEGIQERLAKRHPAADWQRPVPGAMRVDQPRRCSARTWKRATPSPRSSRPRSAACRHRANRSRSAA